MAEHNDFGRWAEEMTVVFLESKGYRILARNYRYQKAEIDLIAEFKDVVVVIEVKARASKTPTRPEEAVNRKKIKLIVSAADAFMTANQIDKEVRFDVVSVISEAEGKYTITHLEDAFESFDAGL